LAPYQLHIFSASPDGKQILTENIPRKSDLNKIERDDTPKKENYERTCKAENTPWGGAEKIPRGGSTKKKKRDDKKRKITQSNTRSDEASHKRQPAHQSPR
jgi:hypothetical protein